jgi:hypothetical protein
MHNYVPNDTIKCCASTLVFWCWSMYWFLIVFLLDYATTAIVDPALIYREEYSFCTMQQNSRRQ